MGVLTWATSKCQKGGMRVSQTPHQSQYICRCSSGVERLLEEQGVGGSIPSNGTNFARDKICGCSSVVESVPSKHSVVSSILITRSSLVVSWKHCAPILSRDYFGVAQLVERHSVKVDVAGSRPATGANSYRRSSTGRAGVSKAQGWEFNSLRLCHLDTM